MLYREKSKRVVTQKSSALFCWPQRSNNGRVERTREHRRRDKTTVLRFRRRLCVCDDDDGDSLKDDSMNDDDDPSLSFPKKGVKCAHHTRFFCVPATQRRKKDEERERERENTTIIVQKEESSSHDNAVQERTTRTGRPRRERSSLTAHERKQLCTSIPIPNSQLIKRGEEKRFCYREHTSYFSFKLWSHSCKRSKTC